MQKVRVSSESALLVSHSATLQRSLAKAFLWSPEDPGFPTIWNKFQPNLAEAGQRSSGHMPQPGPFHLEDSAVLFCWGGPHCDSSMETTASKDARLT